MVLSSCVNSSPSTTTKSLKFDEQTMAKAKKLTGYQCRKVKMTGSRLPQKVCSTSAQRDAAKREAKKLLEKNQDTHQNVLSTTDDLH